MNIPEIKKMIISSLDSGTDTSGFPARLEKEGIAFDFSQNFSDKILDKLFNAEILINRELELIKYMKLAFYHVALPGIAAIVILLISIFLMEGSLSLNSILGLSNNYDESIVCLLTGN